jgi:hypothetical protein
MFDEFVNKLLEGYNVLPRSKPAMKSGPNAVGPGPVPAGFLGGGLPQINPSASPVILVSQKPKKKKKITKKKNRF